MWGQIAGAECLLALVFTGGVAGGECNLFVFLFACLPVYLGACGDRVFPVAGAECCLLALPHGLKIYGEDLTGTRFIDVRTLLSPAGGIGFMKLDYLVDFVMRRVKPLNWQAVLDSPVPSKVVASSLDELQPQQALPHSN
ncbi:hypothetical protein DUNSADRAFT_8619 [Dunaliella salina]|uniref:Encoded protein n=1 Tax=Dunaliella salina TaxID=3046 RepID=A0ABQ7H5T1_DUNSA|nr:hypothetical protein DUNSADRAFT_8619 [Dunaliella salina]|eukprot:KAF5842219.1 hypothetical protein DUNSADRAFT_8619 [Dunaliella salina]